MDIRHLIERKRDDGEHTSADLTALATAASDPCTPDCQLTAWLMAAYLKGMSDAETLALTLAMRDSGTVFGTSDLPACRVDKHSTGGVGDKTSLVVVPLLAASGVSVLKMSGRGLGHTGGTLDKLEAIPGFRTTLTPAETVRQVRDVGAAIVGQTDAMVPADRRLYGLRNATATVDSIPLIAASIMSKKLAAGAPALVLDVKVGRGAFMQTLERARRLAKAMAAIGQGAGVRTIAVITPMDEPLGWAVGNALEVREAIDTLTGTGRVDARFRDLCTELAARGLVVAGAAQSLGTARDTVGRRLSDGTAADRFARVIAAQGGDARVVAEPDRLPAARARAIVLADRNGVVTSIDALQVGQAVARLGAGRSHPGDAVDAAPGVVLQRRPGERARVGDTLAEVHARTAADAEACATAVRAAYTMADTMPPPQPLILEVVE